jgi:hypothetical protein
VAMLSFHCNKVRGGYIMPTKYTEHYISWFRFTNNRCISFKSRSLSYRESMRERVYQPYLSHTLSLITSIQNIVWANYTERERKGLGCETHLSSHQATAHHNPLQHPPSLLNPIMHTAMRNRINGLGILTRHQSHNPRVHGFCPDITLGGNYE